MPLPMMVPATMAMACQTFSSRNRSGAGLGAVCIPFGLRKTCEISHNERSDGTKRHIPGPGDVCLPGPRDIDVQCQSAKHTNNRAGLGGASRDQTEQKYAQQSAVGQRSDRETFLQHVAAVARSQSQSKEHRAPADGSHS